METLHLIWNGEDPCPRQWSKPWNPKPSHFQTFSISLSYRTSSPLIQKDPFKQQNFLQPELAQFSDLLQHKKKNRTIGNKITAQVGIRNQKVDIRNRYLASLETEIWETHDGFGCCCCKELQVEGSYEIWFIVYKLNHRHLKI